MCGEIEIQTPRSPVCWIVSIRVVLNVQQTGLYLHYWAKQVSLPHQLVNQIKNIRWKRLDWESEVKVGLVISRTNADSQWNPVYNAFHRKICCGNVTIRSTG